MAPDAASFASTSHGNTNSSVFDVFLNHRGPEVKKGLASHIYRRLIVHGLRVFLDQEELHRGENITPQIEGAIRTASVQVAIFSPRYAESPWCLNELLLMLESGKTIVPVFYNINPSELRWTRGGDGLYARALSILHCILFCTRDENGGYARALRILEKKTTVDPRTNKKKPRHDSSTVEKWRNALSDVSNISGFELNACNSDEGQLVDLVVEQVLKMVSRTPLNVAKYPTGLDDKVKDVERMVLLQQQSQKARVVGIAGLGGVGKTTLAKEFFNRHRSKYVRSCFVYDVRENAAKSSLKSLQSTLLKELVQVNEQINSTDEGIEKLKKHLSCLRGAVIVVLDDVDHIDQLDALFSPLKDTIHSTSLILVTSRNKDVLTSSGIVESLIYKQTSLNPQHSRELFCSHAFDQTCPLTGFEPLVEKFLDACAGLPLSLKVIGALIRGKDFEYWKAQLQNISEILPMDIQRRLRISYDDLDAQEKQIFLDIACFFTGEDKDTAIRVWDGSRWAGRLRFRNLENRCLVEVDSENRIRKHDHLRDLGRDLAEKEPPACELRLWRSTDNFFHSFSGQSPVRGICLVQGDDAEQDFANLAGSCNLSRLQLLRAEGDFVEQVFSIGQFQQLIYFHWKNYPNPSLPFSIPTKNLRVLHIEGVNLEKIWQHESQVPFQLRELYINAPLSKLPKSIGKLVHLEYFYFQSSYLETFPDEFCHMYSLKHVEINSCKNLTLLPDSLGCLTSLQRLHLSGCSTLHALPDSVGSLTSLQSLNLAGCSALQALPDSVGSLTSLQSLYLDGCFALQALPDSVGSLTSLQILDLRWCSTLQALPDSVGSLTTLQRLGLGRCSALQALPDSVGSLTSLQSLDLEACSALQALPDSVGSLTSLQGLDLEACSALQALPDSVGSLTSLQSLDLEACYALQALPDSVGSLTSLQSLDLNWCCALQALPDSVGSLTSLQSLDLRGCGALQVLPDSLGSLTSLQSLNLQSCYALQALPDSLGSLANLQSLNLVRCSALQALPDSLGSLMSLQSLDLRKCSALQALPDSLGSLTSLQSLDLGECSALQALPDSLGSLTSLQSLDLGECSALQALPDSVGSLTSLQSLHLVRCSALQALSDSVGSLTSLQSIFLGGCSALQALPDSVGSLTSLQSLDLGGCSALQALPDSVGSLTTLQSLNLAGSALQALPDSVGSLTSLQILYLAKCSALQALPDSVGSLTSLQILDLSWCSTLQALPDSVGRLTSLQWLDLTGCSSLQALPDSMGSLTSLQNLYLSSCTTLQALPDSVGSLTSLQNLYLDRCTTLQVLPDSVGSLTSLQRLDLCECSSLQALPDSVGSLTRLESLDLHECSNLQRLPIVQHLSSLKELVVYGCPKLGWGAGVVEELRLRLGRGLIENCPSCYRSIIAP